MMGCGFRGFHGGMFYGGFYFLAMVVVVRVAISYHKFVLDKLWDVR